PILQSWSTQQLVLSIACSPTTASALTDTPAMATVPTPIEALGDILHDGCTALAYRTSARCSEMRLRTWLLPMATIILSSGFSFPGIDLQVIGTLSTVPSLCSSIAAISDTFCACSISIITLA